MYYPTCSEIEWLRRLNTGNKKSGSSLSPSRAPGKGLVVSIDIPLKRALNNGRLIRDEKVGLPGFCWQTS